MLGEDELTVVGNVGDDVEILGLHVSPDLDSLLYTLSGLIDRERGWGRSAETWDALESAAAWGGEDWFRLGDRDIGLHLVRTRALRAGASLSEVTSALSADASSSEPVPPRDRRSAAHPCRHVGGAFPFQEWFVGRRHEDDVDAVEYEGADLAVAAPGVVASREQTPSCSPRATPISHSARSSRSATFARRSRSVGPLRRRQPLAGGARYGPGRPYARVAWQAGRPLPTWQTVTAGLSTPSSSTSPMLCDGTADSSLPRR